MYPTEKRDFSAKSMEETSSFIGNIIESGLNMAKSLVSGYSKMAFGSDYAPWGGKGDVPLMPGEGEQGGMPQYGPIRDLLDKGAMPPRPSGMDEDEKDDGSGNIKGVDAVLISAPTPPAQSRLSSSTASRRVA